MGKEKREVSEVGQMMNLSWEVSLRYKTEVLVVGGGPSGIAAAIASARTGAKTILVERYGFLGGTSTAGLVGPFMTCYSVDGKEQVVKGIFQELIDRMKCVDGAVDPKDVPAGSAYASFISHGYYQVTPFDPEALKFCALEMLIEAGVRLIFHTYFIDVVLADDIIKTVVVSNKSGLGLISANVVVDSTGDGDVAARAGAEYTKGRSKDGLMQPASLFLRVGNVNDEEVKIWAKKHAQEHPEEALCGSLIAKAKMSGDYPIPHNIIGLFRQPCEGNWLINATRVLNIDGTDPEDLTKAEIEGRRQAIALLRFLKKYCPGFEEGYLIETGFQIGIRETRHIIGNVVLGKEDILEGRKFEDSIACYAYPIDIHNPSGVGGTVVGIEKGNFYQIPYRCLIPNKVDNLLVAGRCISATHEAAASLRVIPACYATGEAAGTAAAQAVREGKLPREINVQNLRKRLIKEGAII